MAIDTAMLSAMRDAIGELLPDTCNLLTVTRTPDGMGGNTETWGTASSSVSCRVDLESGRTAGRERLTADALRPYTAYILSIPYDTTITTDYRVEHSGATYAVTSVNTEQSWMAVKRCQLEVV